MTRTTKLILVHQPELPSGIQNGALGLKDGKLLPLDTLAAYLYWQHLPHETQAITSGDPREAMFGALATRRMTHWNPGNLVINHDLDVFRGGDGSSPEEMGAAIGALTRVATQRPEGTVLVFGNGGFVRGAIAGVAMTGRGTVIEEARKLAAGSVPYTLTGIVADQAGNLGLDYVGHPVNNPGRPLPFLPDSLPE